MHAEDRIHRKPLEQAVPDHPVAAAFLVARLLGRLEDEAAGAVEAPVPRQVLCGAQQHGRVAVMAARVHLAVVLRAMREVVRLLQKQRVHIGPEADRPPAGAARQRADHTGAGKAPVDVEPEARQLLGDEVRGAVLLEGGLGMRVQVASPR